MTNNPTPASSAPNPGSIEARRVGCICPVLDNDYGRGYMGGPDFVFNLECSVHQSNKKGTP